jgi:hypothetical protein
MWRSDSTSDPGPLTAVSQAFAIFPALMQLVHTRIRFGAPFTRAFTACRFTFHRRRVTLCACEMLFPNCGPLPQMSHTCAIVPLQDSLVFRAASAVPGASCAAQSFGRGNRRHAQERVPVGLPNSQYTVNPPSQPRRPLLQRHRLRRLPRLRMSANVPPSADHFRAPQHNEIVPAPPKAREPDPIPLRANSLSSIESGLICQGCARFKMSGCARSIPVEVPAEPCPRNCATAPYLSHRHFLQTPLNTCDRCRNCSTWNNCDFSQGPKDATKVCPFTPFV